MNSNRLLLLLVVVLVAGAGIFLFSGRDSGRGRLQEPSGPEPTQPARRSRTPELPAVSPTSPEPSDSIEQERQLATTGPRYEFDEPLPWGGSATFEGRIGAEGTRGVATLSFVAGTNEGRILSTAVDGTFHVEGLLEGLQWVEVRRPGMSTALRVVRLNTQPVAKLFVEPVEGASALGRVVDPRGEPILGARGTLDRLELITDGMGNYEVERQTSGRPLVQLSAEGYETVLAELREQKPDFMPREDRFTLQPEAQLEVVVHAERPLSGEDIRLEVVPQGRPNFVAGAQATYRPIFVVRLAPNRLGSSILFDSLPRGEVRVRASHPEGMSEMHKVQLAPGKTSGADLTIEIQPLIQGRVLRDGQPVAGARVEIVTELPKRLLGNALGSYKDKPLPLPIEARRATRSDNAGRYRLGAFEDVSSRRILRVLDGRGLPVASRVIEAGVRELDIRVP